MRKSGSWMTIWDDRILEYILDNDSGYATEISNDDYIHVSQQHISRRLHELADKGLLSEGKKGVYSITKEGKYYLAGAYDAEEQEVIETELRNYEWVILVSEEKIQKLRSKFKIPDILQTD